MDVYTFLEDRTKLFSFNTLFPQHNIFYIEITFKQLGFHTCFKVVISCFIYQSTSVPVNDKQFSGSLMTLAHRSEREKRLIDFGFLHLTLMSKPGLLYYLLQQYLFYSLVPYFSFLSQ